MFRYYFNFVEIFLANWLKNGHLSAAKTLCKNVQQQLSFLNSIFFRHMSLFSCGLICKIEEAENKFVFLVYEFEFVLWYQSSQWARKFKKVQAKKLVKSNKSNFFFVKLHFWQFLTFSNFKNWYLANFEMAKKMEFGQKNSWNWFIWFHEFFWAGLF